MASGSLWIMDALVSCGSRSPCPCHIAKLQPVKLHSSAAGNNAANSSSGRDQKISCSRRSLLFSAFVVPLLPLGQQARVALAEEQAPERFRLYEDKMDAYSFEYPASWIKISAGSFRNPTYGDELVRVDLSPPSAYFDSIDEFGTPEEPADKVLKQYISETTAGTRGKLDKSSSPQAQELLREVKSCTTLR